MSVDHNMYQKAKRKNQYVIFGSGGLAKELIGYIEEEGTHEIVCVVSTQPFNNKRYAAKYPVVESIREGAFPGAEFLLAVADPDAKQAIVAKNEERWGTYIHSTATVSPYAKIGEGCVLAPQVIVTADAWINDFVFMNTNATVGHDSVIHAWTTMFPNTEVCGDCVIGVAVIMGIGSYVLPSKQIANRVKISAGSIVRHDFKGPVHEGIVLQGNPAAPR